MRIHNGDGLAKTNRQFRQEVSMSRIKDSVWEQLEDGEDLEVIEIKAKTSEED